MILETNRLKLVPPAFTYVDTLFEIHHNPSNQKFNPKGPVESLEEFKASYLTEWIEHYKKYGFGYYVVILKEDYEPIGVCGLRYKDIKGETYLNIYYRIDSQKTKNGYVFEASTKVIEHVQELTNHQYKIVALTKEENIPSIKTAESLGLKRDSTFDNYQEQGNVYYFSE